jgi:predicted RNA binding protein YcfA (HicA-like mRNA interferase family)
MLPSRGASLRIAESGVKVRDVLRRLQDDGWYIDRMRGSHRQLKHPTKPGTVTVAGQPGIDIPPGTLKNIWRQAGLEENP